MNNVRICVVGLGYVGLPLARLFSTKYPTIGYDMNQKRVDELMGGHDLTLEVSDELLQNAINYHGFVCTTDLEQIKGCNFYVVAVPTPVDVNNRPDLRPLWSASETVGKVISKGDIVVYESTVYPGVTEEECLPVVERVSGLKFNVDFFAGYSPERINPGDKEHTVEKIKKVTSGSTPEIVPSPNFLWKTLTPSPYFDKSTFCPTGFFKEFKKLSAVRNTKFESSLDLAEAITGSCFSILYDFIVPAFLLPYVQLNFESSKLFSLLELSPIASS